MQIFPPCFENQVKNSLRKGYKITKITSTIRLLDPHSRIPLNSESESELISSMPLDLSLFNGLYHKDEDNFLLKEA